MLTLWGDANMTTIALEFDTGVSLVIGGCAMTNRARQVAINKQPCVQSDRARQPGIHITKTRLRKHYLVGYQ